MTMPDLATISDEDLDAHRVAVLNEQERRTRLAQAPAQIAAIKQRYVEDGGDPADLEQVLST